MKRPFDCKFYRTNMRLQTATKFARILGISIFSVGLANFSVPKASLAQVCNIWGCSAPGAGECTIYGCPAPAPQPTTAPQPSNNIIIIPGNITPATNTTASPTPPQRNPQQVAACIRELHSFYYSQTSASNSTALAIAQNACRSGASASCIQENYKYYYNQTSAGYKEAARIAQESCAP